MKPPPFSYRRAESLDHALALLAEAGEDAKLLAGGQSLVPALNFRLVRPTTLVDIDGVGELDYLLVDLSGVRVGALRRHVAVEGAAELDGPWRALREAASHVGHLPIRVRGTFGGSLAHADPAAEFCVVAVALEADVVLRSAATERVVPAHEFFVAPYLTAARPDEAVVEVVLATPPPHAATVFEEFSERHGDYALASVCAGLAREDGAVTWARLGLGSVGATALRAHEAEAVLAGSELTAETIEEAARAAARECEPGSDAHASAQYRRELVAALTRRALARAAGDIR